jgi:alpha-L-fucosidase
MKTAVAIGFLMLGAVATLADAPDEEKRLAKEPGYLSDVCEVGPLVCNRRLLLMECMRPASGGTPQDYYIIIRDVERGQIVARFGEGHSLASAIVHNGEVYVFASRWADNTWNDVTLFRSRDLQHWEQQVVLTQEPTEHLFNTSVCATDDGFVMAYESDDPQYVPFTIKFARSPDLINWTKIPGAILGPDRYAACPCLRYLEGAYYVLYLEHRTPAWWFETFMTRSTDLRNWEPSPRNPILAPEEGEDINTSDPDLAEFQGKVYLYYCIGDQRTYAKIKRAVFPGTLKEFFEWCYRAPPSGR